MRILARILQLSARILVRFFFCRRHQTAEPCLFMKIHPKIQPPFWTPKEASGRRLSAGRHAKGSEASAWLGALGLDKLAGLGCSSVPVLDLYCICCFDWEPPDVGLAPTGVWRVPPHPSLQLEDPSLKPKPFPPRLLPPSSPPPTPLALFAMLRESGTGRPSLVWGEGSRGGGGEGPSSGTCCRTHIWGYSIQIL